jgi:N-acetylglucosaminyl-diphospho-decaprenol L-rhamnosyltransferase
VDLEAFWSVGGFDPGYFMYFEDVDLAALLGRRGWQHVYVPSALVVHEGGHATRRDPHRMRRVHHTSAYRYLSEQYRGLRYAPLRGLLRAGLGGRMLLAYVSGRVAAGARFQRAADGLPRPRRGTR